MRSGPRPGAARPSGLKVSHLFWAGGFTGSDGRSYRESVEDAAEALRTAAAVGTACLVVYSGARAGHTFNHARRLILGALKELLPQAAELGVTMALEPMHPGCAENWTFLTSLDETLALLDVMASPQVKMVFDTYHLGQEPASSRAFRNLPPKWPSCSWATPSVPPVASRIAAGWAKG